MVDKSMKRDGQQEGPPAPPSKRQKLETPSDISLLQLSVGPNSKFRKLHRRELVDFFLREADAASCRDFFSFIGTSSLVDTVTVPGAVSDDYKDYRKASDVLKHISHKLINFVSDLQLSGWSCCGKFEMSDVLVTPLGHVRMRTSKIWSLKPQSNRRNRKDFRRLVRVFLKVLHGIERIPADIIHLLNLMKNFSEKDRTLLTHNPATMTEQERLSLLDRLYRSYEALAENDDRLKAIIDGVPYGDFKDTGNYLVRALTNIFIVGVLQYKNPLWLAVPKKKKKKKKEEEEDKLLYPKSGRGVIKLNRNSMQHAFKGLGTEKLEPGNKIEDIDKDDGDDKKTKKKKRPPKKKRMKLGKPIRVQKFQPIQVDHMLGNAFPGFLCVFAKLMNDAGLYEDLIQELELPAPSKKKIDAQGTKIYSEHVDHVDYRTLPMSEVGNHYGATEDRHILLNLNAFSRIRPVLGDGECFYRSFIYSYLEQVLDRKDTDEEQRLLDTIKRVSTENKNLGWGTSEFSKSYKAFEKLIKKIMEWKTQGTPNNIASTSSYRREKLLEFFSTYDTTNDIFVFLRLLVAIHICSHSGQYEYLITELDEFYSLEDWCKRYVTRPREFADHLMMMALATALEVPLRVERLYGGGTNEDNIYTGPGVVSVTLLYTGDHYDVIYPRASSAQSSSRQASQGEHVDYQTVPVTEAVKRYRATEDRHILLNLNAFSRIRPVLGDGECFYRSFIYSYLEQVLDRQDTHEEQRLLGTIKRVATEHKNLGWGTSEFRRSYKAFKKLIKKIMEWKTQGTPNNIASTSSYRREKLLEFFSTYDTTNDIFVFLRLLVAIHICSHSGQYEDLITELDEFYSLEDWCKRYVTRPREFADHLMMMALATALEVPLRVERLYGGGTNEDNIYTGPGVVSVTLLYTGDHYDVIYPRASSAQSSSRQASQGEDPAG